jgi:hypothetical protein
VKFPARLRVTLSWEPGRPSRLDRHSFGEGGSLTGEGWRDFPLTKGGVCLALNPSTRGVRLYRPAARAPGEVTEWSNVHDWKSCVLERVPRVRIPPSPPCFAPEELRMARPCYAKPTQGTASRRASEAWRRALRSLGVAGRSTLTFPATLLHVLRLLASKWQRSGSPLEIGSILRTVPSYSTSS